MTPIVSPHVGTVPGWLVRQAFPSLRTAARWREMSVVTASAMTQPHQSDAPSASLSSRLNWLRAGVLGANDGIVSTAGLLLGVAGATQDSATLLITGLAGLAAGAFAMGGGEYVSVSSQRDTELASLAKERMELDQFPDDELEELAAIYRRKGISDELAHRVAQELTEHDALAAHAEAELGIDPEERTNPWHAAIASMIAFALGAIIPIAFILLSPAPFKVPATICAVVLALLATGLVQARLGGGHHPVRPMLRNLLVGLLAMGVTYGIGTLVGGRV